MNAGQIVRAQETCQCPFCGGKMAAELARIGSVLSRRQMQLFRALSEAAGPLTVGQIAHRLFNDEDQGGPDWADGVVTTAVARLRKKIIQHKLPIRIWNAPEGGYLLEVLF